MNRSKHEKALKLSILLSGGIALADVAIYPAAEKIYQAYPDASLGVLNFILTGPSLILIFASILCGFLVRYIGKKQLIVYGYVIFILTALACVFLDQPVILAVTRGIMGLTMGIVSTAMVGLIAELFTDESARSSILGYYNGIMSALGAVFSFIAGYLAVLNWHYVFLVFLIMIPITAAIFFFVPDTAPEKNEASLSDSKEAMPYHRILPLAAAAFVINAMYAIVLTQIAPIAGELKIGGASEAGIMTSLGTVGSLIACLLFGWLYERLKLFIPVIYSLLLALGFFGLACSKNIWMAGALCTLLGAMYGLSYSYYLMYASIIVPPSKSSFAIAIVNAAVYLGIFVAPYVPMLYQSILRKNTIVAVLPYIAITLVICTVISLIISIRRYRADM
ncbi:MAG: MFS transporter [Lachnospiraceae bacterium]|nr:MFS transporter [Lachnospiraceae bacterium]